MCGGVALYHRFFEPSRSFEHNVIANVFDEYAPLHREPEFLLREELREVESYYAVLVAVADGATKLADVTARSGLAEKSLPYYVQQLVDLGYLERRYPLTGRKPAARVCALPKPRKPHRWPPLLPPQAPGDAKAARRAQCVVARPRGFVRIEQAHVRVRRQLRKRTWK